jgi:hypothetical protein
MRYVDRTTDFQEALKSKESHTPPFKRPKMAVDANSKNAFGKQYLEEAYTVVRPAHCVRALASDMTAPAEPHNYANADAGQHSQAVPQHGFALKPSCAARFSEP